jgi:hypothetical protein
MSAIRIVFNLPIGGSVATAGRTIACCQRQPVARRAEMRRPCGSYPKPIAGKFTPGSLVSSSGSCHK